MDISTAGMAYKKDVAEKYLGTSDRKELEAMLSDWEAFKQVGIDLQKDTNGEVFMFTGLSSVKYIIDGQNPLQLFPTISWIWKIPFATP